MYRLEQNYSNEFNMHVKMLFSDLTVTCGYKKDNQAIFVNLTPLNTIR